MKSNFRTIFSFIAIILLLSFSQYSTAKTDVNKAATAQLKIAVDSLLASVKNTELSYEEKHSELDKILRENVNFTAVSQRVIARHWKKASKEDKQEFLKLFSQTLINSYISLLEKYTNERVDYLTEIIKKDKYASINTHVIAGTKKIPVNYKMILKNDRWKIYDFVVEGISLIRTYNENYKTALKNNGLGGLNKQLKNKLLNLNSG